MEQRRWSARRQRHGDGLPVLPHPHGAAAVDIQPDKINRRADLAHVRGGERRSVRAIMPEPVLRIMPEDDRIQPPRRTPDARSVHDERLLPGGFHVRGRFVRRNARPRCHDKSDLRRTFGMFADDRARAAVREQHMVRHHTDLTPSQLVAGRVRTVLVPVADKTLRLVERHPTRHAVRERVHHRARVTREPCGAFRIEPASAQIKRVGEIPVEKRDARFDARFEQSVHKPVIKRHPLGIHRAIPVGNHPRPRHGEAVGIQADLLHQRNILFPPAEVIASDLARMPLENAARLTAQHVPDG